MLIHPQTPTQENKVGVIVFARSNKQDATDVNKEGKAAEADFHSPCSEVTTSPSLLRSASKKLRAAKSSASLLSPKNLRRNSMTMINKIKSRLQTRRGSGLHTVSTADGDDQANTALPTLPFEDAPVPVPVPVKKRSYLKDGRERRVHSQRRGNARAAILGLVDGHLQGTETENDLEQSFSKQQSSQKYMVKSSRSSKASALQEKKSMKASLSEIPQVPFSTLNMSSSSDADWLMTGFDDTAFDDTIPTIQRNGPKGPMETLNEIEGENEVLRQITMTGLVTGPENTNASKRTTATVGQEPNIVLPKEELPNRRRRSSFFGSGRSSKGAPPRGGMTIPQTADHDDRGGKIRTKRRHSLGNMFGMSSSGTDSQFGSQKLHQSANFDVTMTSDGNIAPTDEVTSDRVKKGKGKGAKKKLRKLLGKGKKKNKTSDYSKKTAGQSLSPKFRVRKSRKAQ